MAAVIKAGQLLATQTGRAGSLVALSKCQFHSYPSLWQQSIASAVSSQSVRDETPVKSASEIPGPKRYPIIGTALAFMSHKEFDIKRVHLYFKAMVKEYGPILRMDAPAMPRLIGVATPEDCEVVMRAVMDNPLRPGFFSLQKIRQDAVDDYFEKRSGLLPENGEEWKRVRSRVQTPMMKAKNVTSYIKQMDEVTLDFMNRITALQEEHGEMPENFQMELYKWALESVSLVALSRRLGCLEPNISEDSKPMKLIHNAHVMFEALNGTEFGLQSWRLFPTPSFRRLKKSHNEFLKVADESIRQTEVELLAKQSDSEAENTLMETLLLTPGLSRKDVITLILDMLIAGIDTTSHTLAFVLYLLARNPKCQAKLQEEVDRVLGDHQGPITSRHLAQLSYLKAVIKETLRLYPVTLGVARTLDKDVVLSGYLVPKGFHVFTLNMLISQDERYYPRADEFVPERWLRHKPLGPIHPYASLPFGAGTRMCIGRRIAEQEMYTFLTRVMQRFSVDYKYEDMDIVSRFVFIPSKPLRFSFAERR